MAGLLLANVWCLLLGGAALRAPLAVTYLACAALLVSARARPRLRSPPFAALLAGAAGFAALPAWLVFAYGIGCGLGLPPPAPSAAAAPGPLPWLAHVLLAPLFEELLYRECLLPALRARLGAPLALVLSSALFAAPHLEAWSVLTTFFVGLALGGVFLATGRVELCVAHHAGLNAAVLVCGLPPTRAALAPLLAALVGGVLLTLACRWTRGRAARPAVHAKCRAQHAPRPRQA
jgi:membrane protease YdiL (CAAX protease family)